MNKSLKERMKKEGYKCVSIDLFSGPGGLCTGFKWAGILPLIAVEWTDTTVETYSVNHNADVFELSKYYNSENSNDDYLKKFKVESTKTLLIHGDINLVKSDLIKELLFSRYGINSVNETIDVVSGGAPCESFSLAGTRTDGDERDDLFSNILRIARAVNTKMILFENVKGMFSKQKNGKKGEIFKHICDSFEDTTQTPSYKLKSRDSETILLKACDYGVPQLRERLFLVAIRRDLKNIEFSYPKKEYGPNRANPYVTVKDALSDLPKVEMGEEKTAYKYPKHFISDNQKHFVEIVRGRYSDEKIHSWIPQHLLENNLYNEKSISSHKGPGHIKRKQDLLALIKENESMKSTFDKLTENGTINQYRNLFPNTIYASRNRRLISNEPSFTVTSHCLDEIIHPTLNRAITPREAARLQSFPDWYQFAGPYVQFHGSKEQDKYEQIGDAIPPLLACAIAKEIVKSLT
ncbi:MAG: DNA cytosine methyltransferase [Lachnospiraceae bacterium]|nr:DNA cytosine methyltransferase [Lachnospiraceae bacterium]